MFVRTRVLLSFYRTFAKNIEKKHKEMHTSLTNIYIYVCTYASFTSKRDLNKDTPKCKPKKVDFVALATNENAATRNTRIFWCDHSGAQFWCGRWHSSCKSA